MNVRIKKSNSDPVNYKGEYHYRNGSTKQQLKGQALNQFLLQKTGITWDSVPVQNVRIQGAGSHRIETRGRHYTLPMLTSSVFVMPKNKMKGGLEK